MSYPLEVPATFRSMPRWWSEGTAWLDGLPDLIEHICKRWTLQLDGTPMHGSNALVVPVLQGNAHLALRLTPPDDRLHEDMAALSFWDGRGTVHLIRTEPALGAMLLERLDGGSTLADRPLAEAMPIVGHLLQQLAVPAPTAVLSTAEMVRARRATMPGEWQQLGEPFPRDVLNLALRVSADFEQSCGDLAVNADMHCDQVLRGERQPWLVVDPLLRRGDIAYDLARVLWTRLDEMPNEAAIEHWFTVLAESAGLDPTPARHWVVFRTVDYWLWGLGAGLTEDPVRCDRLVTAMRGGAS